MHKALSNIENHEFLKELFKDSAQYFSDKVFDITDIELPENIDFDEFEYYIHNVGFYTNYFVKWCKQLEMGVEFISNFDYNNKSKFNRVDHLTYNIENYIVRFQSVSDRLLQIINSVFHLTIDEGNVSNTNVMSNLKVKRTNVPSKFSPIKKYLKVLYDDRNTIIHRHSYLEKELRKLELFYNKNNDDIDKQTKYFRTNKLKDYIKDKKEIFNKYNQDFFKLVPDLFDELLIEYIKQRNKLKIVTGK